MPISWNEIRSRAYEFVKTWEDESSEHAEAKSFWDGFFHIFGKERRALAAFEFPIKKTDGRYGFVDLFWKGQLLVEHKSRGKDLDKAYDQALDYFQGLKERDLPNYVLVSDFQRFRLYDLNSREQTEFTLAELPQNISLFGFIAGYQTKNYGQQDPVNIEAAEKLGKLHDLLKESGYAGHQLEVLLVRLLFCMFAEDTGIFEKNSFREYLENRTSQDGSDLGMHLTRIFQVLDTPHQERSKLLDEQLAALEYINGMLFSKNIRIPDFDSKMREAILDCCALDWSRISPAIFGSLFQSIMDNTARRNLGAHYTSETNILKLIQPLFLDELWAEFEKTKRNRNQLFEFLKKLAKLQFFDPACGCGNFLVIAYRELRLLELEVLRHVRQSDQMMLDIFQLVGVNVDQFHGIEIEEWPARIAEVALWLTDHQMNLKVSEEFGLYYARLPLKKAPHIVQGNALQIDWQDVIPAHRLSYILGNPPFVGSKFLSAEQRDDVAQVFSGIKGSGVLDLVAAWYVKAISYMRSDHHDAAMKTVTASDCKARGSLPERDCFAPLAMTNIKCAFVSTNSITQGEQVGVLWSWMLEQGAKIFFAHRSFAWSNEARNNAAVHCVIIGFALSEITPKKLFEYEDIKGEPQELIVKNINPYLTNANNIIIKSRNKPLCNVPEIGIGNKPIDGGNYLFTADEKKDFLKIEPQAAPYFRRWKGGDEFINGYHRYCLWLGDTTPSDLQKMPETLKRIQAVKDFRKASKSLPTQKISDTPTKFHVENMPNSNYLIIPEVTTPRRLYIPIGFEEPSTLCSNLVKLMHNATLFHFGVLHSIMHNAWMRTVAGRLGNGYRYSGGIVYNNFPWPQNPTDKQKQTIEIAAQEVLDARSQFSDSSLADLYDPLTMPPALLKAHQKLDKAVDAAYGKTSFKSEAERVAFLFERYQQLTAPLLAAKQQKKTRKKKQ